MALPKALTDIPVDNNYSMDEAAIIENLISSGQLSTQQVSDYFNLPVADIDRVLEQDFGYTPEQIAQSTSTVGTLSGVAPTAVQTGLQVSDVDAVENLIKTGQASVSDVAQYFNVPEDTVVNHLRDVRGYNPTALETARAGGQVQDVNRFASYESIFGDNIFTSTDPAGATISGQVQRVQLTPEQIQAEAANILNKAQSPSEIAKGMRNLITFAANPTGKVLAGIERVSGVPASAGLTQDRAWSDFEFRPRMRPYFGPEGQTAGGPQLVTGRSAEATIAENTGVKTANTGGAATSVTADGGVTGGLTGRTSTGVQAQNVFDQQGVGQDLTNVMSGQQGYTGGTLQDGNIRYNDPNVIGGQVNMPQTGVIGAEAALQGGLSGGLAGLQEGLATGATGLTGAVSSGLQELRRALGQGRQDITAGYGRAEQGFQPYMQGGAAAQAQLEALSGARGQEAFNQAYQESPQMAFLREQGMRANLAGSAATGGLGGGNVQKELQRFGQGLASQGLQQQIENLRGLTGQGLQAAQGAGQYAAGGAGQLAGLEQTQGTQALGAMQNVGQQLANLGLAGGQTAAQMGYGTGQSLADIRTRAGELMAGEISNVSRDTSNLAAALGGDISGVYGTQAQNIAQLLVNSGMSQADAAQQTAQMLANISVGAGGQVAGLGTSVGQPQQQQGTLGQVGQAASGIGSLIALSDIRAKQNIQVIGRLPNGLGVYSWEWKDSAPEDARSTPSIGVLAQEVQRLIPDAVTERKDGYLVVDYSKVH